jgi:hypothetical protein
MTNQFGEFFFQFEREPHVTLEIEDRPNHCVRIDSPNPTWTLEGQTENAQRRERGQRTRRIAKKHFKDEKR